MRERLAPHPALCPMLDSGVHEAEPFVVSAFVDGDSLDVALREYGPANIADALPRLRVLADALDSAAAVGVVHGSLHLRDIIVAPEHTVLTGIGVASVLERVGVRPPVRRPYCAPEIAHGHGVSPAGDQFALAAIAHEWLSGRRISGPGAEGFHLPAVDAAGTEAVAAVFCRALDELADARYPTATAFVDALSDVSDALAPRIRTSRRRPAPAAEPRLAFDVPDDGSASARSATPDLPEADATAAAPSLKLSRRRRRCRPWTPTLTPTPPTPMANPRLTTISRRSTCGSARPTTPSRHSSWRTSPATPMPSRTPRQLRRSRPRPSTTSTWSATPGSQRRRLNGAPPAARIEPAPDRAPVSPRRSRPPVAPAPHEGWPTYADAEVASGKPSGPTSWAVTLVILAALAVGGGMALVRWGTPSRQASAPPVESTAPATPAPTAPGPANAPGPAATESRPADKAPAPVASAPPAAPVPSPGVERPSAPSAPPAASKVAAPARPGAPPPPAAGSTPSAAPRAAPPRAPTTTPAPPARTPAKTAPTAAPRGRLLVRSNPSAAEVFVNGERRGVTPLALRDLPLGAYAVRVTRTGFAAAEQRVTLDAGRPSRALQVALQRASTPAAETAPVAPTTPGALVVDSRPAGARVVIDGREVGRTPVTLDGLAPGAHAVRIDLAGYLPITTTAIVEPGARARVAVSLTSERPQE